MGLPGYNTRTALRQYLESFVPVPDASHPDAGLNLPVDWRVEDRLEPEQVAALIAGYRSGATSRDLASDHGIGKTAVVALLRRHGVAIRERGRHPGS